VLVGEDERRKRRGRRRRETERRREGNGGVRVGRGRRIYRTKTTNLSSCWQVQKATAYRLSLLVAATWPAVLAFW